MPEEGWHLEVDAGRRLRGCADIGVNVYLLQWELAELIQRRSSSLWSNVDESEDEDWLKGNARVSLTSNITPYMLLNQLKRHPKP